jgi:hypothetical protein
MLVGQEKIMHETKESPKGGYRRTACRTKRRYKRRGMAEGEFSCDAGYQGRYDDVDNPIVVSIATHQLITASAR